MHIKTSLNFAFVDDFYNYEYEKSDKIQILARKAICMNNLVQLSEVKYLHYHLIPTFHFQYQTTSVETTS